MIEFENVTRRYGRKVAVDGISLAIGRGELFALLGQNGAGKTTSIKMLVGLLRPDEGAVRVCGIDVVRQPREAALHIGYVPDEAYLYDKLTGREFLEFAGEIRGLNRRTVADRIERETERFDLSAFLDDLTETYSHGMRQRVVFASAMLHDPEVLVIDEPMVGLDPRSVRLVKDILRQAAAAGGVVFMSTHTLAVAEEIASRLGIVEAGRLRFLGTVEELRAHTRSSGSCLEQVSLEQMFLDLTNGHATSAAGGPTQGSNGAAAHAPRADSFARAPQTREAPTR